MEDAPVPSDPQAAVEEGCSGCGDDGGRDEQRRRREERERESCEDHVERAQDAVGGPWLEALAREPRVAVGERLGRLESHFLKRDA